MVLGQGKLASVRVSVVPRGEQAETFIGIASTEMIDAYLEDVLHHEITSLSGGSGEFDVIVHSGQTVPAIPVDQEFWLASTIGNSEPLIWSVGDGGGNIAFVMMNSDASPTVDATVSIGVRIPLLEATAVTLLVGGGVTAVIGTPLFAAAL